MIGRSHLRAGDGAPPSDLTADTVPTGDGTASAHLPAADVDTSGSDVAGPETGNVDAQNADGSALDPGKTHMIGDALKSVYQRTLEEDIPDDFLDLLKQLK